ncbi:MAG: hypothetical protein DMD58_07840 [Gemmatimonadetes bacterium]|nr:MAG: hypothetical protein DMD58_07840 [Gemmatimonadota bacterium]
MAFPIPKPAMLNSISSPHCAAGERRSFRRPVGWGVDSARGGYGSSLRFAPARPPHRLPVWNAAAASGWCSSSPACRSEPLRRPRQVRVAGSRPLRLCGSSPDSPA